MSAVIREMRDGISIWKLNNPPVNGLGQHVRLGLQEAVNDVKSDDSVKAVVVMGDGRMFCAGADIKEFDQVVPPNVPGLQDVLNEIEALEVPVVAAIHGVAAGGGLELALSCHYRVAAPGTRLGLPEVLIGILPGAGGTQRLPRLTGVPAAIDLILSGELAKESKAHKLGYVDEITDGDLLEAGIAAAQKLAADGTIRRTSEQNDKIEEAKANPGLFDETRKGMAKRARGMKSPYYALQCVEATLSKSFEDGLKLERDLIEELIPADEAKGLRHIFFSERECSKIPDIPKGTKGVDIQAAGIIGCGTMGGGIAMNFANAGIPVTIVETNEEALDRGLGIINKNYAATVAKGRLSQEKMDERMGLITGSTKFSDLSDADIVIEAVFEEMDIKKEIFATLDTVAKPGAVLATNTSTLDVDEIATATTRPQQVVGTHFFSPANVMKLLENVRGEKSSDEAIQTIMDLSKTINKVGVLAGVCDGFIGNRMLHQYLREANFIIEEGAMPQDVDRVIYEFGFPMGPFAMSDMAGLDVGWRIRKGKTRPNNERYSHVADQICEKGRFGQKTGAGFYQYIDGSRTPTPDPEIEALIIKASEEAGITRRAVSDQEILERCMYPLINEGAKILEEKLAIRSSDIDVIWHYGYGFPRYRGGPMFYADTVGLENVLNVMKDLHQEHGDALKPAALLEQLVKEGKRFTDYHVGYGE